MRTSTNGHPVGPRRAIELETNHMQFEFGFVGEAQTIQNLTTNHPAGPIVIQITGKSVCEFYVFANSGPALRPNSQQIKSPGGASTGISGSASTGFTGGRVSFWSHRVSLHGSMPG